MGDNTLVNGLMDKEKEKVNLFERMEVSMTVNELMANTMDLALSKVYLERNM